MLIDAVTARLLTARLPACHDRRPLRGSTARYAGDVARRRQTTPGSLLQTLAIPAHRFDVCERMADRVSDGGEDRIGQFRHPIVNPQAVAPRVDQPRASQVRQVP
jgi:hypothetical protein